MKWGVSILLLLALAGCRRAEDSAAETLIERAIAAKGREAKVEVDRAAGSIKIDIGGAVAPSGWPAEVPIYPSATKARIRREAGATRWLAVTTGDPVAPLERFYRERLAADGWQIEAGGEPSAPMRARKGSRTVVASFHRRHGGQGSSAEIEYGEGA